MSKKWTPDKLEMLKFFLQEGLSYEEIGVKLNVSKDAVDHTVRRYKLKNFKKVKTEPKNQNTTIDTLKKLDDKYFEDLKKKIKTKWTIKKTNVKSQKNKPFQSYLVIGDCHVPEHNMIAITAILKLMDDIKFDGFINLGDFVDLGCISHWNKTKKLTSEGMKLKEDYIIANAILDEFDKRLPKGSDKHFLMGNHESWYDQFIECNPMLEGMLNPVEELHLKERGYNVLPVYNDFLRIGKLNFTHGMYTSMHYVKKHLDECKSNIMFGHLHSERTRYMKALSHDVAMAGYCVGCLCDMNPDYMKNKPSGWTHGFAVVHFFEDGTFDVDMKRILHGRFIYNSKVYDGNQK